MNKINNLGNICSPNKIGLCFMCYDFIENINFWNIFFYDVPKNEYSIYIHTKNINLKNTILEIDNCNILENCIILENCMNTKWADISLVKASNLLFETALNDGCDYMLLLSSDTISLHDFEYLKNNLTESIFSIQNNPTPGQVAFNKKNYNKLFNNIKQNISFKEFKKQNMFFGITKEDFIKINNVYSIDKFKNLFAPDEYYFINMFIILNIKLSNKNYIYCSNILNKTCSQVFDFNTMDNSIDFLNEIKQNYLFLRKVKNITQFEMMILLD